MSKREVLSMALFHSKKKLKKRDDLPGRLPDFSDHSDLPEFPSKNSFMPEEGDFDIESLPNMDEDFKMPKQASKPMTLEPLPHPSAQKQPPRSLPSFSRPEPLSQMMTSS